jgi:ferritin-like metal-binding protein YciE
MAIASLEDLFIEELKDIYSAENQILKALPRMAKAASKSELRRAFEQHVEVTRNHVARLEKIFDKYDTSPRGKKCKGMEGLIDEGKEMMKEDAEDDVLDAGLIAAAQKVEHYEIASYGTVRTWAEMMGDKESARLLQKTLDEEGETDKKLTKLAESVVNLEAMEA